MLAGDFQPVRGDIRSDHLRPESGKVERELAPQPLSRAGDDHALAGEARTRVAHQAAAAAPSSRSDYPEVELVLSLGTTMLHVEQLHAGEIDVGFVRPPLDDPGPTLLRLRELAGDVAGRAR